ncbi:hypothetical protein, partial [Alistipes shahii]|uniref:hypothetical protein n=1 Tax=Alistipes shahii TaxID=328814 RepID=UPI003AAB4E41
RARTAKRRDWQSGRFIGMLLPGSAPARPKGGIQGAGRFHNAIYPPPYAKKPGFPAGLFS